MGLDPRQQKLFGMFMGPLAVGCAVGLTSFASAGFAPGYTGASMHPGRCFAFAVSRGEFRGMQKSDCRLLYLPANCFLGLSRSMDLVGGTRAWCFTLQHRVPNCSSIPQHTDP